MRENPLNHLTFSEAAIETTEQKIKEEERQRILEEMDLNFLRFSDKEVRTNIDRVLKAIENYILAYSRK